MLYWLLNQFSGTKSSGWRTNIRVSEDNLFIKKSSLLPDCWLKNPLSGNKVALKILTMSCQTKKTGIMTEDEAKDPVARYCGLSPLQQFTKSSTRVLFVHWSLEVSGIAVSSLLSFFLMPLPFKSPNGNIFFAALTKQQQWI